MEAVRSNLMVFVNAIGKVRPAHPSCFGAVCGKRFVDIPFNRARLVLRTSPKMPNIVRFTARSLRAFLEYCHDSGGTIIHLSRDVDVGQGYDLYHRANGPRQRARSNTAGLELTSASIIGVQYTPNPGAGRKRYAFSQLHVAGPSLAYGYSAYPWV